jgi:hypothetical protein
MNIKRWLQAESLPIILIASMVLTRFHHFGDVLHLPDASLAVFFFAGFYRKKALLGFLLVLAALIDAVAINTGTSAWCVSPAYVFLIPTYAVMWFAGRYAATFKSLQVLEIVKAVGLITLASSVAFVISNGSFYLFSGKFDAMTFFNYVAAIEQYYVAYVGAALIYGVIGLVAVKLVKLLPYALLDHKSS